MLLKLGESSIGIHYIILSFLCFYLEVFILKFFQMKDPKIKESLNSYNFYNLSRGRPFSS